MTVGDLLDPSAEAAPTGPPLPEPTLRRWQPLRLGLVELFRYDSEEFWFRDGHLLLRGNNGTGKSKVLSLTLPFLLDANLRSSRIEPDGDPGKKMAWNLLLHGAYERRSGYAWIEFGRLAEDGSAHYLTLGAGLSAKAAQTQVDAWYFMVEESSGARVGRDLWLVSPQRMVLPRERLREALAGRGQVFDSAQAYRRAVDERLFHLGARRYDALIDTLIQLRQPQLSRRPDEGALSSALTESLPPLPAELLADVADAMNQLEEDRRQLESFEQLHKAVARFEQRYRVYAGMLSRRQARTLRQAQTDFDNASRERHAAQEQATLALAAEARSQALQWAAESELNSQRARLDTLLADPRNQDANRLDHARRDAQQREHDALQAGQAQDAAAQGLQRELALLAQRAQHAEAAEQALQAGRAHGMEAAAAGGIGAAWQAHALFSQPAQALAQAPETELAPAALRAPVLKRRDELALVRRRMAQAAEAERELAQRRLWRDEKHEEAEAAAERRAAADDAVAQAGETLVQAWAAHAAGLQQLQIDTDAVLGALAGWAPLLQGDNPARAALHQAQQATSQRLAALQAALDQERAALQVRRSALQAEQQALAAGVDAQPPVPATRGAATRAGLAGAPLWQLVDFQPHVDVAARAGLEAALEAAGLLDAWLAPDGAVLHRDGSPWLDVQLVGRPASAAPAAPYDSLAAWLCATPPPGSPVAAEVVQAVLHAVAAGVADLPEAEAWISPEGRFRLGALCGAWHKPQAAYIGHAARAAARARRLDEIATLLQALAAEWAALEVRQQQLAQAQARAAAEWRDAPADDALRQAHEAAVARAREFQAARTRLDEADRRCREAEAAAQAAGAALAADAADLHLPTAAAALDIVDAALRDCDEARHTLLQAVQRWRLAWPELLQQREREAQAQDALAQARERAVQARAEGERAAATLQVLQESVGLEVQALMQQLGQAREAAAAAEAALKRVELALREHGEARAVAAQRATSAEERLQERGEARSQAVAGLQRFAASGLLAAALPTLEQPPQAEPWTIEPALALARRAEQALAELKDDEDSWKRVQHQINEDLQELQRSLGMLGHQASAEPSDHGLLVQVVYQNRPEPPDRLAARLQDEVTQRRELLTARERELLENHLQDEIAAEVQRLLQAAEKQVAAINTELHKRPTSTGVRYRLQWQALAEGAGEGGGAPVGLHAARERLLRTSADLWTAQDRRVVGQMLQQRIADERQRADAALGADGGGSLLEQLARALDYRRWHVFRVQRLQDGAWRKLSGPASSGERALGLTVPLFAAVASFYSQAGQGLAPRLMLLDEAFAGIDDTARAHCMALIREFDLDFVITSEREWGCYAELPGVAICQLQRREGIDAVYVSRWLWDGRARRREEDPGRRFPPPPAAEG